MAARSDTTRGADTRCLRKIMLDHLDKRWGKSSMDLAEDIRGDFGDCGLRRFHRSLSWLVRVGCVRRDREWDLEIGYWRPIYLLVHRRIPSTYPVNVDQSCPKCGMENATERSHPGHVRARRKAAQIGRAA